MDQLTPNLDCTIKLNYETRRIEIAEYDYFYSVRDPTGWYNNMTKLPSYAFPIPNYKLRAKLMTMARKSVSHTP